MTDDDGTFTFGTAVDEAFIDQIYDQIDDQCHSATNPTVKPKTVTDEVVAARGSKASLDARLDESLEEDGTLKTQASLVSVATAQTLLGAGNNLALNGELNDWNAGVAAAPDYFVLSGAGAAITQAGQGLGDSTTFSTGPYTARITAGGGAVAKLTQSRLSTAEFTKVANIKGQKVAVAMKAKASGASPVRIVVDDGVTTTASAYHTGDNAEQHLSVVHTISASATKLDVYAEVAIGAAAYVGGFVIMFSDLAPSDWAPSSSPLRLAAAPRFKPGITDDFTGTLSGRVNSDSTNVGNVGGGEDDLKTFPIPANTLAVNGQVLRYTAFLLTAANGNNKRIRVKFGASTVLDTGVVTWNSVPVRVVMEIMRTAVGTQEVMAVLLANGVTPFVGFASATETLSGSVTAKITAEATANDDVVQLTQFVETVG
jgi:hypothetical protein